MTPADVVATAGAVGPALEATRLGKRFRRRWALQDCSLQIPSHRVVGLVGPNGAGKTTLLHLAAGLLAPSTGSIQVLGHQAGGTPQNLAEVGFVAQQNPLYDGLSVGDHLEMGRGLNLRWDDDAARRRVHDLELDLRQRVGKLSGGQHAQLALTLAIAKRPRLLILDEPVASLDPLARRDFLSYLMQIVSDENITVILSSHLVADLERICDHLIVLSRGRVQLAGDVDDLLSSHCRLSGPRRDPATLPRSQTVLESNSTGRQSTFLVRTTEPVLDPAWTVEPVGLEDLVLAYMRSERTAQTHEVTPIGAAR